MSINHIATNLNELKILINGGNNANNKPSHGQRIMQGFQEILQSDEI
jgi:hypothetical protein